MLVRRRRTPQKGSEPHETIGQKLLLLIFDKLVIAVAAAAIILLFKSQGQLAQQRLEKARKIRDIAIDKPLSLSGQLAGHFDELVVYASQVRAGNIKPKSQDLTSMQMRIFGDIEGSRAYYATDAALAGLASDIRATVNSVKAQALTTGTLSQQDMFALESARFECNIFHTRMIDNSIRRVSDRVDAAYDRSASFWVRMLGP